MGNCMKRLVIYEVVHGLSGDQKLCWIYFDTGSQKQVSVWHEHIAVENVETNIDR